MISKNKIILSKPQTKVWKTRRQLNLDIAGQRSGKSQMIGVISGYYITNYPKAKGFIAANTYMQFTQSTFLKTTETWRDLWGFTEYNPKKNPFGHYVVDKRPPAHFEQYETFKEYHNIISFWNGAVVFVGSLDNYKAHDGKEFCWAHLDETKDTKEEALTTVILARLSQRGLYVNVDGQLVWHDDPSEAQGLEAFNPAWIHTSPAVGNVDWLLKMFELDDYAQEIKESITREFPDGTHDYWHREWGNKKVVIFSTYHNEKNLPSNYIEGRKAILSDNEQMKFIYGFPFSKTGSEYYSSFSRLIHVNKLTYIQGAPIHVTWDFNVMPYMTCLCAQILYLDRYQDEMGHLHMGFAPGLKYVQLMQIRVYKEYTYATPRNTIEAVSNQLIADHPDKPDLFYYGDASGRNRIEGLGSVTQYSMIEDHLQPLLNNESMRVRRQNMNPLKRRDLMNQIFEGKHLVELLVDDSCIETIRDLENLKLAADGKLKEKVKDKQTGAVYEKLGHTSDALEYLVCEVCKHLILEPA